MVCLTYKQKKDPVALEFMPIYLSYIHYMQNKDGTFRNFLSFNRNFMDEVGSEDSFGRTIWALGYLLNNPPNDAYYQTGKLVFFDAAPNFKKLKSIRGIANTIIGICYYMKTNGSDDGMKQILHKLANKLVAHYNQNQSENWKWFESLLAYDNGILPLSLLHSAQVLEDKKVTKVAFATMEFITEHTLKDDYLSIIGNKDWYLKDKERSMFAQQPLDAQAMVLMYHQAYVLTGDDAYLKKLFTSFMWFLGENDMRMSLYDFETKGCCDGFEVSLFASGNSITSAKLESICELSYEEDRTNDPKVLECLHISHLMEKAERFDIIHNHFNFLPLSYSRLIKTAMITTIHGFSSPKIIPVYKKYNTSSAYISISNADRHKELTYLDTIYHGVDPEKFSFNKDKEDYLLYFGRIHPEKGTREAIEIAKNSGYPLKIAGLIQDTSYFETQIKHLIDQTNIEYLGNVGPVARNTLLGKAKALIHPISFEEPFGLSVLEAMMCGTPVIAFARGSMPELIKVIRRKKFGKDDMTIISGIGGINLYGTVIFYESNKSGIFDSPAFRF